MAGNGRQRQATAATERLLPQRNMTWKQRNVLRCTRVGRNYFSLFISFSLALAPLSHPQIHLHYRFASSAGCPYRSIFNKTDFSLRFMYRWVYGRIIFQLLLIFSSPPPLCLPLFPSLFPPYSPLRFVSAKYIGDRRCLTLDASRVARDVTRLRRLTRPSKVGTAKKEKEKKRK